MNDTESAKKFIEQGRTEKDRQKAWDFADKAVLAIHGRLDFFAIPWVGAPAFPDWELLKSRLGLG